MAEVWVCCKRSNRLEPGEPPIPSTAQRVPQPLLVIYTEEESTNTIAVLAESTKPLNNMNFYSSITNFLAYISSLYKIFD